VWTHLVYTALSVALPLLLARSRVVFHASFRCAASARPLISAMMATPPGRHRAGVDHEFHPQLGILNTCCRCRPATSALGVHPATVIPSLVLVESGNGHPLVMLIVLGGLAASRASLMKALIDGATRWQTFLTSRCADHAILFMRHDPHDHAVKSLIYLRDSQGGPG